MFHHQIFSSKYRVFTLLVVLAILGTALTVNARQKRSPLVPISSIGNTSIDPPGFYGSDMKVQDHHVYMLTPQNGGHIAPHSVRIIDVSDILHPVQLSALVLDGWPLALTLRDKAVYVLVARQTERELEYSLEEIDASDVKYPRLTRTLVVRKYAALQPAQLETVGKLIYVISGNLDIIDVSPPDSMNRISSLYIASQTFSVTSSDTLLAIAMHRGISLVDITSGEKPRIISVLDGNTPYRSISIQQQALYAVTSPLNVHLMVFDISNPLRARVIATTPLRDYPGSVANFHGYLLISSGGVAEGSESLQVIDVNQPSKPKLIGVQSMLAYGQVGGLAATTDYALLAADGLWVLKPNQK